VTVTVPPQIRTRGGIRSTVEQEQEEEFGVGRYHATVESRHSATETSGYLATFSDAAEWDWRHPPRVPPDTAGTELTIVGQVVAPFLLTRLLRPALVAPPHPG
jgi:hypothetical protein